MASFPLLYLGSLSHPVCLLLTVPGSDSPPLVKRYFLNYSSFQYAVFHGKVKPPKSLI